MLYIIRHQQGDLYTNCLSKQGLRRCGKIYKYFTNICVRPKIYTCFAEESKHIRPIQTASTIATLMNKSIQLINIDSLPDIPHTHDIIMVWHHHEINEIIQYYSKNRLKSFLWKNDNYDGCVLIDTSGDWRFEEHFFTNVFKLFVNCKIYEWVQRLLP